MQTPPKKKFSGKYSATIKIAVAREYLTSDLGYMRLADKYNIPRATIASFVKWYREKYPDGTTEALGNPKPAAINRELDDANLKVIALQLLIENAGKELGVDLVKKFGTKQSQK